MPRTRSLFVSDRPLDEAASFNFEPIIRTLQGFISSVPLDAPLNICVSGEWGTGKTTLLRGLRKAFDEVESEPHEPDEDRPPRYVTLWFDPWKLSSEEEVRNALARAVLEVIERDADFASRADIAIDRKNVLRMLSDRLLRVDADDLSTIYKAESRTKGTFVEVEQIFQRVADVYLNDPDDPRRLVIFVDDLDRCRPARITEVLESVKLFFDLPGLIFIFALDRAQLEQAVAGDYGFTQAQARVYLEKVFQLTVPLPRKRAADLRQFLESKLEEIGVSLENEGLSAAIVDRFGRNLRNLKLFINSFSFQRQLIGNIGDLDEEALFRWLYLEGTMDQSMTVALRDGSPNLVLALEFLAHGAFLHDPDLHRQYVNQLNTSAINFAILIIYSIVYSEDDAPGAASFGQRSLLGALRGDGAVAPTLRVLREGKSRLIDSDLPRMIYLTRSEDVEAPIAQEDAAADPEQEDAAGAAKSEEEAIETLAWGSPLSAKEWDDAGDEFRKKGESAKAYLCYLAAHLMAPQNSTYLCDLGRTFRSLGRLDAARLLFSRSYRLNPTSKFLFVEAAYLHDIDLLDEEMGTLLYRKALMLGSSTSSPPSNLSLNLHKTGQYEHAYFACLDACVKAPDDDSKQDRLIRYARDAGFPGPHSKRPIEALEAELAEARAAGRYPFALNEEEERRVKERLLELPDAVKAATELSRAPL